MAFTHRINMGWSSGARALEGNKDYSGDGQVSEQVPVADSTTDKQVSVAIDVSQIQAVFMQSDQNLKVETNNGTTPDDTIDLVANVPYVWTTDSYDTCLLTTDVTALFLSNSSGAAATFELEVVLDTTP